MKVAIRTITTGRSYYEGEVGTVYFSYDIDMEWISTDDGVTTITTSRQYRLEQFGGCIRITHEVVE